MGERITLVVAEAVPWEIRKGDEDLIILATEPCSIFHHRL